MGSMLLHDERMRWIAIVAALAMVVLALVLGRPAPAASSVVVRITDGGTPIATQVVSLHP